MFHAFFTMKYQLFALAVFVCSCQAAVECPLKCACVDHTINCSRKSLAEVPTEGTVPHARTWDLSHNNISTLHHDTFLIARHFKNPFDIDLSHNNISNVSDNAFNHLGNIEFLDLSGNNISHIEFKSLRSKHLFTLYVSHNLHLQLPEHGFVLPHLKVLEMERCGLTHIPSRFFAHMKDIETLGLARNKISTLGTHVLTPLKYLVYLDLSENKFTVLPSGLLNHLDISVRVRLNGNPFACGCSARASYDRYLAHRRPVPLHCGLHDNATHLSFPHYFEERCPSPPEGHMELGLRSLGETPLEPSSTHRGLAVAGVLAGVIVVALMVWGGVRIGRKKRERDTCPQRFSILQVNEDV